MNIKNFSECFTIWLYSKNGITNLGAGYIANMLKINNALSVLFLNWNLILTKGGMSLCKAIEKNDQLQVFDISFNNIGSTQDMKMAQTLKSLFLANTSLIHIDISHCKFTTEELKTMSEWWMVICFRRRAFPEPLHFRHPYGGQQRQNWYTRYVWGLSIYRLHWCWKRLWYCSHTYCFSTHTWTKHW